MRAVACAAGVNRLGGYLDRHAYSSPLQCVRCGCHLSEAPQRTVQGTLILLILQGWQGGARLARLACGGLAGCLRSCILRLLVLPNGLNAVRPVGFALLFLCVTRLHDVQCWQHGVSENTGLTSCSGVNSHRFL